MRLFILFVIFCAGCMFIVDPVFANVEFNISVIEQSQAEAKDNEVNRYEITVDLGEHYFSYMRDGYQYIYDFKKKRIMKTDPGEMIFSDDSLYSDIGLRTHLFEENMNQIDSNAKDKAIEVIKAEHQLSLLRNNDKTIIHETSDDDNVSFFCDDMKLLSYSRKGTEVSREEKRMFVRFFRYIFGGHPLILRRLTYNNSIPDMINFFYSINNKEVKELKISNTRETSDHTYSLENCSISIFSEDKDDFLHFLFDVRHSDIDLMRDMSKLLIEAERYFQAGQLLDSVLTYFEYRLVSGFAFPRGFDSKKPALEADENVLRLFTAMQPPENKEIAKEHIEVLTELEKKAQAKKYMITLFKANNYLKIGEYEKAKNLYQKALMANPYIVSAYDDLGGIYYNKSNMKVAWRCWDLARRIAPANRTLVYLNSFEKKFEEDYPEYF